VNGEEAHAAAEQLALAVERRRMPPWGADNTGSCGRFIDAAWLEDSEIARLRAWAAGGAPVEPLIRVAPSAPAAGTIGPFAPQLQPAPGERRITLSTAFTPGLGRAATRCFLTDVPLDGGWAIGSVTLRTDPPLAVQQMMLFALTDPQQLEEAQRLEDEDEAPGWSCYGGARIQGSELSLSWSWLNPLQSLPAGSAIPSAPGLPLVMQLRYNLIGTGIEPRLVRASAEVILRPREHAARLWSVAATELQLPPNQRGVEVMREVTLTERLQLLGVIPQLHGLGRALLLEYDRDGQRSCLASFAHWNPSQEQLYRYREGFELDAGDRVRLTCAYDTTGRADVVQAGEAIDREECRAYLYISPPH
jgi:hypothetical protein